VKQKDRHCAIRGCKNEIKHVATLYCSIKCAHIAQKAQRNAGCNAYGILAILGKSRSCARSCTQGHTYECKAETFLEEDGIYGYVAPHFLRRILMDYYGERCLKCGWARRHPITGNVPIEVEHIDGNWENSRLTNLTLLCPNCHALTPTFRGLNRGRGRAYRLAGSSNMSSREMRARTPSLQEVFEPLSMQLELSLPT
jgi:hypothetical protein